MTNVTSLPPTPPKASVTLTVLSERGPLYPEGRAEVLVAIVTLNVFWHRHRGSASLPAAKRVNAAARAGVTGQAAKLSAGIGEVPGTSVTHAARCPVEGYKACATPTGFGALAAREPTVVVVASAGGEGPTPPAATAAAATRRASPRRGCRAGAG